MTPVVCSKLRPTWQRLPSKSCFYYRSGRFGGQFVLTWLFSFDRVDDEFFFAYSFPYTYTDLQRYLYCIERLSLPYVKRELLSRSAQGRALDLLTITDPKNMVIDAEVCRNVLCGSTSSNANNSNSNAGPQDKSSLSSANNTKRSHAGIENDQPKLEIASSKTENTTLSTCLSHLPTDSSLREVGNTILNNEFVRNSVEKAIAPRVEPQTDTSASESELEGNEATTARRHENSSMLTAQKNLSKEDMKSVCNVTSAKKDFETRQQQSEDEDDLDDDEELEAEEEDEDSGATSSKNVSSSTAAFPGNSGRNSHFSSNRAVSHGIHGSFDTRPICKDPLVKSGAKPIVVLISARVHPGETPASYLMQGIIDVLLSDAPLIRQLREKVIFKIIPMLNPDGVYVGNYRTDTYGLDLNRTWHFKQNVFISSHSKDMPRTSTPSCSQAGPSNSSRRNSVSRTSLAVAPMSRVSTSHLMSSRPANALDWQVPTVSASRALLTQLYSRSDVCSLDIFIDLHAHSTAPCAFMYCNNLSDVESNDRVAAEHILPRLLGTLSPDFSYEMSKFDNNASKTGSARRSMSDLLPGVSCYTFEASFFCSLNSNSNSGNNSGNSSGFPAGKMGGEGIRRSALSQLDYIALGNRTAESFCELYGVGSATEAHIQFAEAFAALRQRATSVIQETNNQADLKPTKQASHRDRESAPPSIVNGAAASMSATSFNGKGSMSSAMREKNISSRVNSSHSNGAKLAKASETSS